FQAFIWSLMGETLRAPQSAARRLMTMNPPMEARWLGLVLVAVLALLVSRASVPFIGTEDIGPVMSKAREMSRTLATHPWIGVPVQALSLLAVAVAMQVIGRLFGGTGRFADALLLFVWLEFLMALLQGLQLLAVLAVPVLGALIGLASYGLFLWLMTQFTAALHGFVSPMRVFAGMVVSFFAVILIAAVLMLLFGVVVPVQGGGHV
ncbi:MAG: YIP1 family protein, partial [Albidovulum sp.]